jgi:glycosidase
VYYGTEVGVTGSLDPDCRRAFPWDESKWDNELLTAHRELTNLRHAHSALRAPGYETLHANGMLYVFERFDDDERVVVAVNAGDEPASATLGSSSELLWGDGSHERGQITVPGRSGAVWLLGD